MRETNLYPRKTTHSKKARQREVITNLM